MQYRPVTEDSFAKDSVKLVILPFVCIRGSMPLGECRKIVFKYVDFEQSDKKPQPTNKPTKL